jgi:hypothetical protein
MFDPTLEIKIASDLHHNLHLLAVSRRYHNNTGYLCSRGGE